jgi:serine/threonine protein kinase/tetratricopeptide (TPR) repeat protein
MTDSQQPSDPAVLSSLQAAIGPGYLVERELGGGGMSRVFVATETALARRVAVKVLSPELFQGVSAERFAREVALAAQLQDPHIVPVLITGATADGLPWYTMPFIEGESLRARMQRGAIPLDEVLRILRDVAEALEYAHGRGIVHRDIKPENVLLSGRSALVTDFGIAKAVSMARGSAPSGTLTSIGLSLGTPAYMSPEQVAADTVDHRADLYAWGIMAYELLGGAHPFAMRTQAQMMAAHLSEMPRALDEVRPGLPSALTTVVMLCLAKSPAERPADAAALLSALSGATTDSRMKGTSRLTTSALKAKPRTKLLATVALGLVLAGGVWFAKGRAMVRGGGGSNADTPSLAVLPFEHQGDSSDLYLTDGITDEIRNKLTGVRELIVIARTSSTGYRNTTKSPRQVAEELDVRWLLTGTVRVTGSGNERRVIVRPELVEMTKAGQPQSRWGQPFDVSGADVLGLQGQVAAQVVAAMEVPIVAGADRVRLNVVPTRDPQAYDLFLRGRAATSFGGDVTPPALEAAILLFEQAVARDSTFVPAWHALTSSRANLYSQRPSTSLGAAARAAAERTLALDPTGATGAKAMGGYLRLVAGDAEGALAATERAVRADPSDISASANLAISLMELGRIDEAFALYEGALRRDPRHIGMIRAVSVYYALRGRQADARAIVERQRALAPRALSTFERRITIELFDGDTLAARRIVAEAQQSVPQDQLFRLLINNGYAWLAEPSLVHAFLARGPEAVVGTDSTNFQLWKADFAWLTGDSTGQRVWGDSAQRALARRVASLPTSPVVRTEYAQALAHAGLRTEALREARNSLTLVLAQGTDRRGGTYMAMLDLAASVAMYAGDHAAALDWLEEQRSLPLHWSPSYLRVNPYYAPLRGNPRFERLTAEASL